ncbi:LOW QUALITY PROTEIN: probable glucomannan 4-beta-mannosyltransferase 10 [Raphanus sativus]|uniref:glucomannan 4-beta-mannosyltransferase n=1 Tax=Raphanus sativus TaxID=3726 RepID=A0A6J0JDN6_RAPSA|nr:LOW QUALITY PROTEIN: probable glucomannan 4-beta-mannosyltransferase 10 [Raphanus sativus]
MALFLKPLIIFLHDSCLAFLSLLNHGASFDENADGVPNRLQAFINGVGISIETTWGRQLRSVFILPVFNCLVASCLIISLLVFIEGVYMNLVVLYVKLFKRKPEKIYKWEPMQEDAELGHDSYPMVLVQIPMYNEKEVLKLSIGAACRLTWPLDRLIVQVLDDSTDETIKELVNKECAKWENKGVNIKCERRENRNGYKAGALKQGMKRNYVKLCNYVAIFDADFQPEPDYLQRSVPFLVHNPTVALVQARWRFTNANKCLMTRIQEMSLNYHFMAEQESGSTRHAFFSFNGTAGVWRMAAMEEAGGWNDRTTVEDMDLAVRVGLLGWKFVFLDDLMVKSELPSKFKAFRFQQHRWSCGPANLFRKMIMEIIRNKRVTLWKKLYLIYSFFFLRKILVHFFTFFFYCVVLPTSVFFPEVNIPAWSTFYIPSLITLFIVIATPRSFYLVIFWVLFENVMSMHRTKGTFIGILEGGRVNEWVVTEKLGDALKTKLLPQIGKPRDGCSQSINSKEIIMGIYILCCACYGVLFGNTLLYLYLFMQAVAFLVSGVGFVGT